MYTVENPAFRKKLTPLEEAQHGPRRTGVGAQILGADDKYICQYSQESQYFWGSKIFFMSSNQLPYLQKEHRCTQTAATVCEPFVRIENERKKNSGIGGCKVAEPFSLYCLYFVYAFSNAFQLYIKIKQETNIQTNLYNCTTTFHIYIKVHDTLAKVKV